MIRRRGFTLVPGPLRPWRSVGGAPLLALLLRAVVGIASQPAYAEELGIVRRFDSIDVTFGSLAHSPSRPNVAVGPDHVLVGTTFHVQVFDRSGVSLSLESLEDFLSLPSQCEEAYFPDVLFDGQSSRWIGALAAAAFFCLSVSSSSDPLATWYRYAFPVDTLDSYFHVGIGVDALYLGAQRLSSGGRVFAIDKAALYAGANTSMVVRSLRGGSHPVPITLHGQASGTWPTSDRHHFVALGDSGAPAILRLYSWSDALDGGVPDNGVSLDLESVHGTILEPPVDNPQAGSGAPIAGFESVPLDFEYRDGFGYVVSHASCQPAGDAVNCLQWAKIDLETRLLHSAGVFGTDGVFRAYGDLAVDRCGNLAIGYSRFSTDTFPSSFVAGALATDPPGTLSSEIELQPGDVVYQTSSGRWGEFTGMTLAPDGRSFWYAGVYSKDVGGGNWNWGTTVGELAFPSCTPTVFADGFESGNTSSWSSTTP